MMQKQKSILAGRQSWRFPVPPLLLETGTVVGKAESQGPLAGDFDVFHEDPWLGGNSFELAEQKLLEEACSTAIRKANLTRDDINVHLSGDLLNQITSSSFTARSLGIPYLGLFGACSTSIESLALASVLVAAGACDYAMASSCSHTNTAEKQFRYPNEYGSQKCNTAQCTVTAAGAGIVTKGMGKTGVKITAATVGKVIDMGVKDPFNMGAAMAPAAADTILAHFQELNLQPQDYDLILTGDLGKVGHQILLDLMQEKGMPLLAERANDGGKMIYPDDPKFFAGASGCGCMAAVTYGHIFRQLQRRKLNKVLCIATGALLSPLTTMQQESIPGIAHAVALEFDAGQE